MGYTLTQVTPELFLISPNKITDWRIQNLYLHICTRHRQMELSFTYIMGGRYQTLKALTFQLVFNPHPSVAVLSL